MKYRIAYWGWTEVELEASTKEAAIASFWDKELNDLRDVVIEDVFEVEE